jgi:hypothetical protein
MIQDSIYIKLCSAVWTDNPGFFFHI